MYTVERINRIREVLCLKDGDKELTVPVDLNVDAIQAKAVKAWQDVGRAQEQLRRDPKSPECMEAYGTATLSLFSVIFGEEGANKILAFYEENYTEMLLDVFPFLNGVILPKIAEASAARRAQLTDAARSMKKKSGFFKR